MIKSVQVKIKDNEILLPLIKGEHKSPEATYYSILVGPNGTSKSRILSSIAFELSTFDLKRKKSGPQRRFENFVCKFDRESSFSRVLAIASSPYDKFPAGSVNLDREFNISENKYFYLGLRSKNGHGLRKNKDRIFDLLVAFLQGGTERQKIDALKYIFKKLNFNSKINLVWEVGDGRSYFEKKETGFKAPKLGFLDTKTKGEQVWQFNLVDEHKHRFDLLQAIIAERNGLIKIKNLLISKKDENGQYDLLDSSSGELSLFVHCLGLAACLKNRSIILIDEPEISLHPNWQIEYLDILQMFGKAYRNCHFILATHSPHILASLPTESSNVIAMRHSKAGELKVNELEHSTGGWSVEQILLDVFGIQTIRNRFFEKKVRSLLELIADPELPQRKNKIKNLILELDVYELRPDDPLNELLNDARSILGND